MKYSKVLLTTLFCVGSAISFGQTPVTGTQPDNTRVNKRDKAANEPTADQQKTNASDQDLTRKIRQSIIADKSLSTYAHNIKIISQNGTVTLKGPVKSDTEQRTVIEKAVAVVGSADKVTNEISVKR
jgi:hyperosmotically inducible protein